MAEQSTEQPKQQQKSTPAKQIDFQVGGIGHQSAAGAGAPAPLDSSAVKRIQRNPTQAPRSDLLALQRAVGNRAVAALVRGATSDVAIQAKLEVGPANDEYEREAEQIARTVTTDVVERKPVVNARPKDERDAPPDELKPGAGMSGLVQARLQVGPVNDVYERQAEQIARMVTSGITQRKPAANVKSKDDRDEGELHPGPATIIKRMVQRKEAASAVRADGSFTADTGVHDRLQRLERGGRPLPDTVRREMEPRFGADFGGVRIHTGGEAVQLSRDIGARAFTHGSHIAFGSGGFAPNSQAGRHLLAHELTHTIQQTGASPLASVQRRPTGVIQRGPTWEKIKGFFSRAKPEPVVPDPNAPVPVSNIPKEIQKEASSKARAAWDAATVIISTAESAINAKLASRSDVTPEMGGMESSGKLDAAKNVSKQMKGGDQAAKTFLEKYRTDLKGIRDKIQTNLTLITQGNALLEDERMLSGGDEDREARGQLPPAKKRQLATQNFARAVEAEKLLEQIKKQSESMGDVGAKADVEEAFVRGGLEKRRVVGSYEARSLPAAEKSASDSVLDLLAIRGKVQGYYSYLETDFKVLEGHLMEKGAGVTKHYGESASLRAMGSGTARGEAEGSSAGSSAGSSEMMTDDQAFELGGSDSSFSDTYSGRGQEVHNEEELSARRQAEMAAGQDFGENMVKKAQEVSGSDKGKKPEQVAKDQKKPAKLNKPDKKFAKEVKRLEIRSMLMAKANKRMPLAKQYTEETDRYYEQANDLYKSIDGMRRDIGTPTAEQINVAVVKAGDARAKVALAAVNLERMRKFKKEVYDESQKHEKYVGPRAMSATKRRVKKFTAMTAGVGLKVITGGLYRVDAQEEAGGYRVNFKGVSLWDDIQAKNLELMQIQKGLDGKHIRGMGGRSGAEAYAFFKGVSFALQIVRDIASACALWVTIVTAGVGAPVGAIFASLALFATIAKAAIDLMLVIWSGTALANTNDPQSRMILRGENMRHGLALGEGLVAGVGAGAVMGVSGNTGLLNFQQQTGAFGSSNLEGSSAQSDRFGAISNNWSQGGPGGEFTYGGMLRDGANVGIQQGSQLGNIAVNVAGAKHSHDTHAGLEKRKLNDQKAKLSKAKLSVHALSPAAAAFKKLGELAVNKKPLRKAATQMPEVAKNIQELVAKVDSVSAGSESQESESESVGPTEQAPVA